MGKTTKDAKQKSKWAKIATARTFKESHTEGMVFKAADRSYIVTASGAWKRVK